MNAPITVLRQSVRSLAKRPGFVVVTVLTLGLAIGANTAIFSLVDAVLLRPLPYPDADRLVQVWTQFPEEEMWQFHVSPAEFSDYRDETHLFDSLAAYFTGASVMTGGDRPERVEFAATTASFWPTLGVEAAIGRVYGPAEDRPGNSEFVVLADSLWRQRFGGNEDVVGRRLMLDGTPYTILGVLPPGFAFPGPEVQIWGALGLDPATFQGRTGHYLEVVGRLAPGAELEQVQAELDTVTRRWSGEYEHAHPMTAVDLREQIVGDVESALWILLATVAAVLLIACANISGLLLARASARHHEMAIRSALGSDRGQLVRYFLGESVVLSACGAVLGLLLAAGALRALHLLSPENLPRLDEVSISGRVLLFTLVLSVLTTFIFGILPALRASLADPGTVLKEARSDAARASASAGLRAGLVVAEVAVALVLVVGAGLLLRTLWNLQRSDPGFRPEGVLTGRLFLPDTRYPEPHQVEAFFGRLVEEVEALPGVDEVSHVDRLPLWNDLIIERFEIEGQPRNADDVPPSAAIQVVAPDYFSVMGIPQVAGRRFQASDRVGSPRVVLVNETLARSFLADRDAVGRRLRILASRPVEVPFEVVGVVADIKDSSLSAPPQPTLYVPHAQAVEYLGGISSGATLVVRTSQAPGGVAEGLRRKVRELDPELPIFDVQTMDSVLSKVLAQPTQTALLLSAFSAIALILAAVGIYGLLAQLVGQRTRELGIRFALGADRRTVIGQVLRQGVLLALAGVVVGLAAAAGMSRLMESLLFGVEPLDPVSFSATALLLTAVALLAGFVPAYRASRVDPMRALRAE